MSGREEEKKERRERKKEMEKKVFDLNLKEMRRDDVLLPSSFLCTYFTLREKGIFHTVEKGKEKKIENERKKKRKRELTLYGDAA